MNINIKGCLYSIVCILAMLIHCNFSVQAQESLLTIVCTEDQTHLSNVNWKVYKVYTIDSSKSYTLTEDFSNYPITTDDLKVTDSLQSIAYDLKDYVTSQGIQPLDIASTDGDGIATLIPDGFGVYLLVGEPYTTDYQRVTPIPCIVEYSSTSDGVIYPKYSIEYYEDTLTTTADTSTTTTTYNTDDSLPQTGHLWYIVPIMILLGATLITIGYYLEYRGSR